MKIKSLWISKYRNIENLEFKFDPKKLIVLLVGQNGLGKSNLIEILAKIFKHLHEFDKEADLLSWTSKRENFEFKITYQTKGLEIKFHCLQNELEIQYKAESSSKYKTLSIREFRTNRVELYLPKYIIGYYSGENKRIRKILREFEEKEWGTLKSNKHSTEYLRPIFFLESHHAQFILATFLLLKDVELRKKINSLLGDYLNIEAFTKLSISFKSPNWNFGEIDKEKAIDFLNTTGKSLNRGVNNLFANIESKEVEFPFWDSKGKLNQLLRFLLGINEGLPGFDDNWDDQKRRNRKQYIEYLYFNNLPLNDLAGKLEKEFGNSYNFLQALESTLITDVLNEIKIEVRKKHVIDLVEFTELSEGEQQLMTVLGIILLVGHEDCLFLLDEPDTHLNPKWQRHYVELVDKFNLNNKNSQIYIATHSPLLVQAADKRADILLFTRDSAKKVQVDYHKFEIANWRIDHVLLSKYFDLESTRRVNLDGFIKKRNKIIAKGKLTKKDKAQLKKQEDKIGYLPTGETIAELQSHLYIKQMAERLSDDKNQ